MTAPLPPYRVLSSVDGWATVAVQLPDFSEGQLTVKANQVGTPDGDAAIRQFVDARAATQDILRGDI